MVRGTLKPKQTEVPGCLKGTVPGTGGKTDWGDEGWRFSNRWPSFLRVCLKKQGIRYLYKSTA